MSTGTLELAIRWHLSALTFIKGLLRSNQAYIIPCEAERRRNICWNINNIPDSWDWLLDKVFCSGASIQLFFISRLSSSFPLVRIAKCTCTLFKNLYLLFMNPSRNQIWSITKLDKNSCFEWTDFSYRPPIRFHM